MSIDVTTATPRSGCSPQMRITFSVIAAALWLGLHDLVVYTLIATILGGFLTLMLLGMRQLPLPAGLARQDWILKLHDSRSGIPYGVALAAGVFAILPQAEVLRLAAAG